MRSRHAFSRTLLPIACPSAFAILFSTLAMVSTFSTLAVPRSATAGSLGETEGDLVPSQYDNCWVVVNGPNQASNQVDTDQDGYGNRCDTDYDDNLATTAADFGQLLGQFGRSCNRFLPGYLDCEEKDHDGNLNVTVADFGIFLQKFSSPPGAPGPSGLACAGTVPCNP